MGTSSGIKLSIFTTSHDRGTMRLSLYILNTKHILISYMSNIILIAMNFSSEVELYTPISRSVKVFDCNHLKTCNSTQ